MRTITRIMFVVLTSIVVAGCSGGGGGATESYSIVIGTVTDTSGTKLGDVAVTTGTLTANTNSQGYFSINNVPVTDHLVVNFAKDNFVTATQVTTTKKGESMFLNAVMASKATPQTMNATTGGTVSYSGASVVIPANGLVTASGSTYTGTANVALTVFDPTTLAGQASFPGEFIGVTKDGQEIPFASYGFIDISAKDSGGNLLKLADGKTATINIPIPASLVSSAPTTMPLWYFNENDGKWHEETTGTKSGNVYTGTITHFSVWNSDVGYDRGYVKGRVEDCTTHTPIECARVNIRGITPRNCWTSGETCTDSDGGFNIPVDANSTFSLVASKNGTDSDLQTLSAPGTESTKDIGIICLNAPKIKIMTTWGANPADLDAHLTYPAATGTTREHVYYGGAGDGSVTLDTDAQNGFGPEIITVFVLHDGVYRFSVHHYNGTGTISTSGANVDMVISGKGIYHKTPPGGATAVDDAWALWDITVANDEVTSVKDLDTIQHNVSSSDTAAFSPASP